MLFRHPGVESVGMFVQLLMSVPLPDGVLAVPSSRSLGVGAATGGAQAYTCIVGDDAVVHAVVPSCVGRVLVLDRRKSFVTLVVLTVHRPGWPNVWLVGRRCG